MIAGDEGKHAETIEFAELCKDLPLWPSVDQRIADNRVPPPKIKSGFGTAMPSTGKEIAIHG